MFEWVILIGLAVSPEKPQEVPFYGTYAKCNEHRKELVARIERTHRVDGSICKPRKQ